MALLEVRALRAGYERIPVVFGVDLDVDAGEVVALLGANGAGKTTTLRAISGMVPVLSGSVAFDGVAVTNRPAERIARAGLLHVPAGRGVFPNVTVGDTLRLAAALAGLSRVDTAQRLADVEATFPRLAERSSQTAGTLSGGEQQMLALARGLITRPRLLMVDEMSQGLAPTIVAELFRVLDRFTEQGVAVLLVEQFVSKALAVADRAYVLEKGEVSFDGAAADLAADEDFVRGSYLGDAGTQVEPAHGRESEPRRARLAEEVQISLPPALLRSLQERSRREGVPVGELVRQVVEGSLTDGVEPAKPRRRAATAGRRAR